MSKRLDEETEAGLEGFAELLYECGLPPERAQRLARRLFELASPEFGEDNT